MNKYLLSKKLIDINRICHLLKVNLAGRGSHCYVLNETLKRWKKMTICFLLFFFLWCYFFLPLIHFQTPADVFQKQLLKEWLPFVNKRFSFPFEGTFCFTQSLFMSFAAGQMGTRCWTTKVNNAIWRRRPENRGIRRHYLFFDDKIVFTHLTSLFGLFQRFFFCIFFFFFFFLQICHTNFNW